MDNSGESWEKKRRYVQNASPECFRLLTPYLGNPQQNIGRNKDSKSHSVEVQLEMRNMLFKTGEKIILVIK